MPTLTIVLTTQQGDRVAAAFGSLNQLGRDATAAEVRAYLIAYMKAIVGERERAAQIAAISIADLGVT